MASLMPKYGNFENRPISRKLLPIECKKHKPNFDLWGRNRVYVQLPASDQVHTQIWQFWKSARISETSIHRAKTSSIWTPYGRKSVCAMSGTFANKEGPCATFLNFFANSRFSPNMEIMKIETLARSAKIISVSTLWGKKTIMHVQLLELCSNSKLHVKLDMEIWKMAVSRKPLPLYRAKRSSLSTLWNSQGDHYTTSWNFFQIQRFTSCPNREIVKVTPALGNHYAYSENRLSFDPLG